MFVSKSKRQADYVRKVNEAFPNISDEVKELLVAVYPSSLSSSNEAMKLV